MLRWLVALALALSAILLWSGAEAQTRKLSDYEKETLRRALEHTGYELEDAPEGKWVESIEVVSYEVFEDRDYLPTTFPSRSFNVAGVANWFHTVSRPWVIRREVLLRPGKKFDWSLVNESERNLRVRQLSVVLIVPVRGSRPEWVRLMAVTKDVWSLRLNTEPRFVNGSLDYIALQPSEENLFGAHKTITGLVELSRATYSMGLGYIDPRISGSRLQATANASIIFNCQTNDSEGSFGSFSYGKPLFSTRTRWGWVAALTWDSRIVRPASISGAAICSGGQPPLIDFAATPVDDAVPYQYDQDALYSQFSLARSFGVYLKNDFSFGLESKRLHAEPMGLEDRAPVVRDEFRKLLPTNDTRLSPFAQFRSYRNKFLRLVDVETLGLQEDYRLGHDVWLRAYPAAKAMGSSRDLIGVFNGLSYTLSLGDGYVRGNAEHFAQLSTADKSHAEVTGTFRLVTPRVVFLRGVVDLTSTYRYINYLNPSTSIGGTDRLRGYRAAAFVGPDYVAGNFELRTGALRLPGVLVGAVAFWDMGDAARGFERLDLKHAYGGGLRVLLPQLDRAVFRVDVGFPLDPNVPFAERTIIAQFRQAFDVPKVLPPALVPQSYTPAGAL